MAFGDWACAARPTTKAKLTTAFEKTRCLTGDCWQAEEATCFVSFGALSLCHCEDSPERFGNYGDNSPSSNVRNGCVITAERADPPESSDTEYVRPRPREVIGRREI